jgi:hypothetical protein
MPNEHFRHMAAGAIALGAFYCSAQRLLFARELGSDVLAGASHLPIAILIHHHVPRFVHFVLHLLRSAQTNNAREASGFETETRRGSSIKAAAAVVSPVAGRAPPQSLGAGAKDDDDD